MSFAWPAMPAASFRELHRSDDQDAFMATTAVGADMIGAPISDAWRRLQGGFSVVDMVLMQPDYEPIRSLVYSANDRAIKDVYVDGRQVVRDGEVLDFDIGEDIEMLRRAGRGGLDGASTRLGRPEHEELSPRSSSPCTHRRHAVGRSVS